MRLLVLVLAGCLNVLKIVRSQELSVIRHSDGDIFTLEGSCTEACTVLSSGTASPYTRSPSTAGLVPPNNTCTCQCNHGLPIFREDLHICVSDIHECNVGGFVSNTGQIERVPYVFLPQRGQIIYPHAEIQFEALISHTINEGVTTPVCGITGAQQLGRAGWSELKNLSDTEPPFRLFRDEGRTFLQWIGETGLRAAAEGRVVTAKLVCRDASPKSKLSGVFTPCVAFRVAGSPSKSSRYSWLKHFFVLCSLYFVLVSVIRDQRKINFSIKFWIYIKMQIYLFIFFSKLFSSFDNKISFTNISFTVHSIPEEETNAEHCDTTKNQQQSASNSAQSSVTKSRKSQRCTGCPGCRDSFRDALALSEPNQPNPGESKVRAWLEDVRSTPQRRWQDAEEARKMLQENTKTFNKNLEYLRELAKREFDANVKGSKGRLLSSWKDNPPMMKTFQNVARSEILEMNDQHSVSKRSTKSMFEESSYYSLKNGDSLIDNGNDIVNDKVRKAIENSFIKQMEENVALEKETVENPETRVEKKIAVPEDENNKTKENGKAIEASLQQQANKRNENSTRSKKELPDMINELPNAKNTAKRIMDAVIREMVDAKVLDHSRSENIVDYEVDSLERSKSSRKSSTSPESTDQSSPALSTALPMDEELTMQNAVINTKTGEMMIPNKLNKDILERGYYNSLPELISSQKLESYSLVSEVYVNDGYDSPACSDDSGPEIQYEPENPGHLTIKVQDSSKNYVKHDESEYEPDTLDRKPMKLKINDDVNYEKDVPDEIYVDSLERPAQILLKSKGSFRDQDSSKNGPCLQRNYGSLREIYEARLKSYPRDLANSSKSLNGHSEDSMSWKKCKYLTPETRQLKRQRQPSNQPDVVPLPPTEDDIYQQPKPPRRVKDGKLLSSSLSKNGWDRSPAEAGDPTTSNGAPVPCEHAHVGTTSPSCPCKSQLQPEESMTRCRHQLESQIRSNSTRDKSKSNPSASWSNSRSYRDKRKIFDQCHKQDHQRRNSESQASKKHLSRPSRNESTSNSASRISGCQQSRMKVEDSGYLSSTDSNGSHKQLLRHEVSSVSETDETESVCDGASESGAESIGTDSVFFGNFRKHSGVSNFSKSVDSGVEIGTKNTHLQPFCVRNENGVVERANFSTSDSETESFITVLLPYGPKKSI
ncbi:hypothetical protein WN51_04223 [Melipona quadrifasciata]|uniref:Shavenoid isoform B-like N-terminal domain-containing protein n=1 Tax=Melipona quadrifasciata TaxID=166423 RepID=A0A0M8ZU45_9HYME|nr:hypothetical protein WN51_04223 [Melipona quadrifasciata]